MQASLDDLRKKLDQIDSELIVLLKERFDTVKQVGEYKKIHNMQSLQPVRWEKVLQSRTQLWEKHGISKELIEDIWNRIHDYALELEDNVQ